MKKILRSIIVWILEKEAILVLLRHKPKIVAVTGNVGKTSTKDAIYTVMSTFFVDRVRKSEKSFNSEIGVPLTILGLPNAWNSPLGWIKNIFAGLMVILSGKEKYPKWLVLEVGADRPGDIKRVSRWLRPDVVVVTRLSKIPVHVEYFNSPADLFKEKGYLVQALKEEGLLILNKDDDEVMRFEELSRAKKLYFGYDKKATVSFSNDQILYGQRDRMKVPEGVIFKINHDGNSIPVSLEGVLGQQHMYPVVAAITVGLSQKLNLVSVAQTFKGHQRTPGRMNIIEGVKGTTVIDDTYNSSPAALSLALHTLSAIETKGRKIAVLGDMLELGRYATKQHKRAGTLVAESCDLLMTVGVRARYIAEGALEAGMSEKHILQYEKSDRAGKELELMLKKGDVVLVKGSQGMRMEKVVEEIMAHPEDKEYLLVRQEAEWENR